MIRGNTIARILYATLGIVVLAVGGIVAFDPLERASIASRGGRALEIAPLATPHYMQTDARWSREMLGGTIESLGASGCTVCCVSMAMSRYGIDITPGDLNRRVAAAAGYTEHGWLKWSMVEAISRGSLDAETPRNPDFETLDDALVNGWPVVTKIRLRGEIPHWVLIVGKSGVEYLARDPLVDGRLVTVSERSAVIESIRIVRPA
jgi:hypothetical protein